MTDQQALHLYATQRDAEAFRQIVDVYQRMVYASAMRRLGNAEDAADATQQAFVNLARHAHTVRGDVGAWLHRTVVNAATDLMRSAGARRQSEQRYAEDPTKPRMDMRGSGESWEPVSRIIDEAIAELDDEQRELIVEHFLKERPQRELAAERGQSQATVSRRVQDAVAALRTKLEDRGVTAPAAGVLATGLAASTANAQVPAALTAELAKAGLAGGAAVTGGASAGLGMAKLLAGVAAAGVIAAAGVSLYVGAGGSANQPPTAPVVQPVAAAPTPPVPQDVLDRLGPVAPLVGPRTIAVGQADLQTLDPAASLQWLGEQISDAGPEVASIQQQIEQGRVMVSQWRETFLAAGGTSLYLLVAFEPTEDPNQPPVMSLAYFAPLGQGADAEVIRTMLAPFVIEVPNGLLFAERQSDAERVQPGNPGVPSAMAEALQQMPSTPGWIVVASNAEWAEDLRANLGDDDDLGLPLLRELLDGQYLYVGLPSIAPPSVSAMIEAGSADQAQSIAQTYQGLSQRIRELQENGGAMFTSWAELMLSQEWDMEGSRLTWVLTPEQASEFIQVTLMGRVVQARARAGAAHRLNQIRQVLVTMHMYRNDHDRFPDTLAALRPMFNGHPLDEGLIYLPPSEEDLRLRITETMVIHDQFETWPELGLPVGFADGHTEVIRDRDRFEVLLDAAKR